MKKLMIALAACVMFATAAEAPKPSPLTAEEQEQISRRIIRVLQAQAELERATAEYRAVVAAAQEAHGARGCDLNLEKQWVCQPAPAPAR